MATYHIVVIILTSCHDVLLSSERVRHTGSTGTRLNEAKKINASLSALGNVIAAPLTALRRRPCTGPLTYRGVHRLVHRPR